MDCNNTFFQNFHFDLQTFFFFFLHDLVILNPDLNPVACFFEGNG